MQTFKKVRFYLVWILAAPFILLYLIGVSVFSGQWKLIGIKMQLIQLELYQKFGKECLFIYC
ncbi:hypothetical protein HMF3257_05675 [Spirosoma telluris]|uniref:Uncharacterized protein n=1 Tax=Spirosoma telluris TaxID=2183553 RepID=A0A327NGQ1_9BACT|nr:hypothetical protein HMF3257_05675 [Spirosoma telluris]